MTWIEDSNGNRCSVEYWGSKEKAQEALDSLKNCKNCTNCSGCSRCSGCATCFRCSDCSRCARCSDCAGCAHCSHCSGCARCFRCATCFDCSRCARCSGCARCSDCSGCARLFFKRDIAPGEKVEPIVIPVIPNIHKVIYEAVSQPQALDMGTWHSCETTHCRAGWTVQKAGEAGKKLEAFYNTELAAMLIYDASGFQINPSRFYDSNEDAMADMKRLAEQEA